MFILVGRSIVGFGDVDQQNPFDADEVPWSVRFPTTVIEFVVTEVGFRVTTVGVPTNKFVEKVTVLAE